MSLVPNFGVLLIRRVVLEQDRQLQTQSRQLATQRSAVLGLEEQLSVERLATEQAVRSQRHELQTARKALRRTTHTANPITEAMRQVRVLSLDVRLPDRRSVQHPPVAQICHGVEGLRSKRLEAAEIPRETGHHLSGVHRGQVFQRGGHQVGLPRTTVSSGALQLSGK